MRRTVFAVLLSLASLAAAPPLIGPRAPLPPNLRLAPTDRYLAFVPSGICGVSFSPDGKRVTTAGFDHRVRVWDTHSGKHLLTFAGHKDFLRLALFSPDGKTIASGGNDLEITLWDSTTGDVVRRLPLPNHVYTAVFTPDGKHLVCGDFTSHVRVFDLATGKQIRAWQTHRRVVYALAVSPDGTTLATGGDNDTQVHLWDLATGAQKRSWQAHDRCVNTAQFSPDGRLLATGGADEKAVVWEIATGKAVREVTLTERAGVKRALFSRDGRVLFLAHHGKIVTGWEMLTGNKLVQLGDHGSKSPNWIWGLAVSPDDRWLISAGADGAAILWDLRSRLRPPERPVPLTTADRDLLWADLARDDAPRAYRSVHELAGDPARTVEYLKKHLKPAAVVPLDPARVARLIDDLDSDKFATREQATAELEKLCPPALPLLRKALEKPASLEVKRRLEKLVAKFADVRLTPEELRHVRAVHVLEEIGSTEARAVLRGLADGAAESAVTHAARAAAARLGQ